MRRAALVRRAMTFAVIAQLMPGAMAGQPSAPDLLQLREPGLLGLLEMPWLLPSDPPTAPDAVRITAYAAPAPGAAVSAVLDNEGVTLPDGRRICAWVRDIDARAAGTSGCQFSEAGYEEPALPVLAVADGSWYRIGIADERAADVWIQSPNRFHSIVELLAGGSHLTYLVVSRFDGWISQEPEGARIRLGVAARPGEDERPYEALEHAIVNGRLWLYVRILDRVCEATDPREIARGWVPAKTAAGELQAWFWSRGC